MVQGKAIPETTQWIIIRLTAALIPDEDVAMYTDVSVRKV
jgi:hypothetical protein